MPFGEIYDPVPTLDPLEVLIETLLIERACTRLCVEFARRLDLRRKDLADLFTDDAHLIMPGHDLHGRMAIGEFAQGIRRDRISLHLAGNLLVDAKGESEAHGTSDMICFSIPDGAGARCMTEMVPSVIGICKDVYRRNVDGWKMASRVFQPISES